MASRDSPPAGGRLESWKEIAAHLGRSVSTVQRWEREEGLPVRRHRHKKRGSAHAFSAEVDEWWRLRAEKLAATPSESDAAQPERPRRGRWWVVAAALIAASLITAAAFWTDAPAQGRVRTLAVLPLAIASGDAESEYLADGLTEGLIDELGSMSGVRVIGRASAFSPKNRGVAPRAVGRSLHADAVLTGRVTARGAALDVDAELISVADGTSLWRKRYSAAPTTLAGLPREMRRDIARRIGVPQQRLRVERNVDDEVYRLCLRGRYFWNKRTPDGLHRSIELFRTALQRDANYAEAWRGLADAYNVLPEYSDTSEVEAYPAAKHAAIRALQLDPELPGAHASLGFVLFWWERDTDAAEAEFLRALDLNPNHATAHHWYGNVLLSLDRVEEALKHLEAAQRADPLSLIIGAEYGAALYHARRFDEAAQRLRSTLELDPGFVEAHFWLTRTLLARGDFEAALREAQAAREGYVRPAAMLAEIGLALERSGRRDEGREQLARLESLRDERTVGYELAILYAGLGQTEAALAALERAAMERSSDLSFMSTDPAFDAVRGEARFQELQARLRRPRASS